MNLFWSVNLICTTRWQWYILTAHRSFLVQVSGSSGLATPQVPCRCMGPWLFQNQEQSKTQPVRICCPVTVADGTQWACMVGRFKGDAKMRRSVQPKRFLTQVLFPVLKETTPLSSPAAVQWSTWALGNILRPLYVFFSLHGWKCMDALRVHLIFSHACTHMHRHRVFFHAAWTSCLTSDLSQHKGTTCRQEDDLTCEIITNLISQHQFASQQAQHVGLDVTDITTFIKEDRDALDVQWSLWRSWRRALLMWVGQVWIIKCLTPVRSWNVKIKLVNWNFASEF